jgi:uncharacterized protein (DUF427 family)
MTRKPPDVLPPGPGQESVWDYPRPPAVEADNRRVEVIFAGEIIADSDRTFRVLETSHPPTFYIPPGDVRTELLESAGTASFCEFKGRAVYFNIRAGGRLAEKAAWCYPEPAPGYDAITGHFAFYAGRMDRCVVGGQVVRPQEGGFYGGWITPEVVGPFKGKPGTGGW